MELPSKRTSTSPSQPAFLRAAGPARIPLSRPSSTPISLLLLRPRSADLVTPSQRTSFHRCLANHDQARARSSPPSAYSLRKDPPRSRLAESKASPSSRRSCASIAFSTSSSLRQSQSSHHCSRSHRQAFCAAAIATPLSHLTLLCISHTRSQPSHLASHHLRPSAVQGCLRPVASSSSIAHHFLAPSLAPTSRHARTCHPHGPLRPSGNDRRGHVARSRLCAPLRHAHPSS